MRSAEKVMTTETEAISHLRALIKDPMGHVAESCEFLARVDAGKSTEQNLAQIEEDWYRKYAGACKNPWFDRVINQDEE